MDRARLIQGLIFVLVVSLAIVWVCSAGEVGEVSHVDSTSHVDGSHDVCLVASCYKPLGEISTLEL